jgi:hypothetical protein
MNLTTVQTALTAWIESASSLECEWEREPQKLHMGAFILAQAGTMGKLGHDERVQTYDGAGPDTTSVRVVGVRLLPLQVSFLSFDQRLGGSARQYAEEFRTLIHTDASFELLSTAELALVDTGELTDADYTWSGRMVSRVNMDVTISLRADFEDTLHDGSYIKTVNHVDEYDTNSDGSFDLTGSGTTTS